MDMLLTDDQLTLADGVRDYLTGTHGPEVLRRLDAGGKRDAAIWQGLVDMGLPGLCVPEAHGGLGLGLVEAALIAAECGRACLAEPLVDTAFVAAPWLAKAGLTESLADIAAGNAKVALVHSNNPWVADLESATHVLSPTCHPGGSRDPYSPASESMGPGLRRDDDFLDSVDPLRRLSARTVDAADDHLLNLAALMSAAQLVGIADAMLAQATEYAKIRQQFGQPIGAFQAVKHQLASAMVAIEFAKPVVWRAAQALEDGAPHAAAQVSHAKVAASDAATAMAETAIQVHGAMGYTYEVDLHFWMKRAWALAGAWGDRAFHLARVDAAVIGGAMPIGPEHTFA